MRYRSLVVVTAAATILGGCALAWDERGGPRPDHPFVGICSDWSVPAADASGSGPAELEPTLAELDAIVNAVDADAPHLLADACLRLNQIQVIGSHNSDHVRAQEPLWSALSAFDPGLAASLEYTHSPLPEQFDTEEVRQIELDVFADPDGGRYADRHLNPLLGLPLDPGIPELHEPGFKVFHVQEVDYETTCLTFVACLRQIDAWSDAHPSHLPIAVLVELKDDVIPDPIDAGFTQPLPIGATEMDALDAEIRSVFDDDEVLTPDDVRSGAATLESAILTRGWPTLAQTRGQVMFLMDNEGGYRSTYLAGHPSLAGRMLFTSAAPGNADAAFVKRNDPLGSNTAAIQDLVRRGYIVRTRADSDTVQARSGDTTMRDAALASGAQWVSTDYPVPGRAAMFGTDYAAVIPDGSPARCNPLNTGPRCRNGALERL